MISCPLCTPSEGFRESLDVYAVLEKYSGHVKNVFQFGPRVKFGFGVIILSLK